MIVKITELPLVSSRRWCARWQAATSAWTAGRRAWRRTATTPPPTLNCAPPSPTSSTRLHLPPCRWRWLPWPCLPRATRPWCARDRNCSGMTLALPLSYPAWRAPIKPRTTAKRRAKASARRADVGDLWEPPSWPDIEPAPGGLSAPLEPPASRRAREGRWVRPERRGIRSVPGGLQAASRACRASTNWVTVATVAVRRSPTRSHTRRFSVNLPAKRRQLPSNRLSFYWPSISSTGNACVQVSWRVSGWL